MKKANRKIWSLILSIVMLFTLIPANVFAGETVANSEADIIDVEVFATWYPVDKNTNEVLDYLTPIKTYPDMYPRSEVAKANDAGVYEIDYMGVPRPDPGAWSANHFMYTANLFFTNRFHRVVAQGRDERNFDEEISAVRRLVYGSFNDEAPYNSETGKYTGLHGMTKALYQEGQTMDLYIAAETEDTSLSDAVFTNDVLNLTYEGDDDVFRDLLYNNIEEVKFNDFDNWAAITTLDGVNDQDGLRERLATIYLYKYDKNDDENGSFIEDGDGYKDFAQEGFAFLEEGKYEVVVPVYWGRNVPEYMSAPDVFSRNRYKYDDTIHYTLNVELPIEVPVVETLAIDLEKVWKGRPGKEVTIILLADGEEVSRVTLSADNNWKHSFAELEKVKLVENENGTAMEEVDIDYSIKELVVDGYTTKIDGNKETGFIVTNEEEIKPPVVIEDDDEEEDSGGGGGGGPSPDPVVEVEDEEIPLGLPDKLNVVDHYRYLGGYPDNTIRPEGLITRDEVATVFFRLLTPSYRDSMRTRSHNFRDVEVGRWSEQPIAILAKAKIISGYEDASFRPGKHITRAELAAIASRFDDLDPFTSNKFSDIEGHWANEVINSAAEKGWVNGYEDGTFRPDQHITRAEFVALVNNVLNRRVREENILPDAKQFPDLIKGKWYYEAMQEAINSHKYTREKDTDYEIWTEIYYPDVEM